MEHDLHRPDPIAEGEVMGYWQNYFSADSVEQIVAAAYDDLKSQDLASASFSMAELDGTQIVDINPKAHGNLTSHRDDLFTINLVKSAFPAGGRGGQGRRACAGWHSRDFGRIRRTCAGGQDSGGFFRQECPGDGLRGQRVYDPICWSRRRN